MADFVRRVWALKCPGTGPCGPQFLTFPFTTVFAGSSDMEFERASLEIVGPVAILRMNDPDVLNALSPPMLKGMTDALDALAAAETPARCLVLTGTGRAFSTGANLQGRGKDGITRGAGQALETLFHPFMRRLRDLPCPIVTAVNGPAAGAGMSLALMGDLILCARSAYF